MPDPSGNLEQAYEAASQQERDLYNFYENAQGFWTDTHAIGQIAVQFMDDLNNQWDPAALALRKKGELAVTGLNQIDVFADGLKEVFLTQELAIRTVNSDFSAENTGFYGTDDARLAQAYNAIFTDMEKKQDVTRAHDVSATNLSRRGVAFFAVTVDRNRDTMQNEVSFKGILDPANVVVDPLGAVNGWENIRYSFERILMSRGEANARWPGNEFATTPQPTGRTATNVRLNQHSGVNDTAFGASSNASRMNDSVEVLEGFILLDVPTIILRGSYGVYKFYYDGESQESKEQAIKTAEMLKRALNDRYKQAIVQMREQNPEGDLPTPEFQDDFVIEEMQTERVHRFYMQAYKILEPPTPWWGNRIPIIPVTPPQRKYIAADLRVDTERQSGESTSLLAYAPPLKNAFEAQRQLNTAISNEFQAAMQLINLKPYVGLNQVGDDLAASAADPGSAYVIFDDTTNPNIPGQYTQSPATGLIGHSAMHFEHMLQATGQNAASITGGGKYQSGKALEQVKSQGFVTAGTYVKSYRLGVINLAQVLMNIIPEVYSNAMVARIDTPDVHEQVRINEAIKDPQTGVLIMANDLSRIHDLRIELEMFTGTLAGDAMQDLLQVMSTTNDPSVTLPLVLGLVDHLAIPNKAQIVHILQAHLPDEALSARQRKERQAINKDKTPPPEVQIAQLKLEQAKVQLEAEGQKGEIGVATQIAKALAGMEQKITDDVRQTLLDSVDTLTKQQANEQFNQGQG